MAECAESRTPVHVAVIMDGNGRWAHERGLPRFRGHEEGAKSVEAVVRGCRELGIRYLTLYAFSVENWSRPEAEKRGLMRLLGTFLREREHELHEHRIRLRVIGRAEDLPVRLQKQLRSVGEATASYDDAHLILALSYGGRTEIAQAARRLAQEVAAGTLTPEAITEDALAARLYAPDVPDPDLMIRTSGEQRISNFLLWQLSYAELYFTDVMWPDFREPHLQKAIQVFRERHRRFGGLRDTVGLDGGAAVDMDAVS